MSTFKKSERLSSKKQISSLVINGNTLYCYPFKILWLISPSGPGVPFRMEAAFSVPRRKFKKAVRRNTIRRRMKEAFRLNKEDFKQHLRDHPCVLSVLIIFTPRKELGYAEIDHGIKSAFQILKNIIQDKTP